jgi:hypothetical protein
MVSTVFNAFKIGIQPYTNKIKYLLSSAGDLLFLVAIVCKINDYANMWIIEITPDDHPLKQQFIDRWANHGWNTVAVEFAALCFHIVWALCLIGILA